MKPSPYTDRYSQREIDDYYECRTVVDRHIP